ncbi:hypothetical protein B0H13DRAFT_1853862 [Mycena leptocephala]|nr:hypothetical protein B0H13DRAFT_1853862 [Mycena leptocephala]
MFPPKRRLTKLDDMQRSIKQEKLDNIVIEIDDASDEEETVRSRKAKGKGRRVGEVIVVDDEDGRSSHYSTLSLSITFSSSLAVRITLVQVLGPLFDGLAGLMHLPPGIIVAILPDLNRKYLGATDPSSA